MKLITTSYRKGMVDFLIWPDHQFDDSTMKIKPSSSSLTTKPWRGLYDPWGRMMLSIHFGNTR